VSIGVLLEDADCRNEAFPIFLITAYAKNEKDNLRKKVRNELEKRAYEIFAKYGS